MEKKLVIVESPAKARTISKFLGSGYSVKSSMGHVRDLPVKKLGIDTENKFKTIYEIIKEKNEIVKELRASVENSSEIYIATDEDREGEAIGWHLIDIFKLPIDKAKRVVFHEITEEAILDSFKHTTKIDMHKVAAQQARRILDRLVGYKISPLLSSRIRKGLSAGRVQSVVLRIIVDREKEIGRFVSQEYWLLNCSLKKKSVDFIIKAHLVSKAGVAYKKLDIKSKEDAEAIVVELKKQKYTIEHIERKVKKRNPFPPYTTSTLQQEAYWKAGFSPEKTMRIAQQLYEGIKLGEDTSGLITYMRTDSLNISKTAQEETREYIRKIFGKSYLPEAVRFYKTKSKTAQEAHEAIRPTSISRTPEAIIQYLNPDQFKLYELVWKRFLASQMANATFDAVTVYIRAGEYLLAASGQTIRFNGYLIVYTHQEETDIMIPALDEGEILELESLDHQQHFTEPPPRFNEASLIKLLEARGIGRPSTYAPIINTIVRRKYAIIKKKQFIPAEIGITVNSMMLEYFPEIINIGFTAEMEKELDEIALGKKKYISVLNEFYTPFKKSLENARNQMENVKPKDVPTKEVCEKCGQPMVIRQGRFGKFLACSGFPKCKNAFPVNEAGEKVKPEVTDKVCEKCGKQMVVKTGRRGRFLACSGYPDCKSTLSLDGENNRKEPEATTEVCEKCSKPMVIRTGRRGRFLACSGFPKCKNVKSLKENPKE